MKIIITENKLEKLINTTIGHNLSDHIEMITSYWDAESLVRSMFRGDIHTFNKLLNNWGPMYFIKTLKNGEWLAQQRKGGEWFIYNAGHHPDSEYGERIDEFDLLSKMGLDMFGLPLGYYIEHFVKEED